MDPRAPYEAPLVDRLIARAGNVDPDRYLFTEAATRLTALERAYEPVRFLSEQLHTLGIADKDGTLYDTETGLSLYSILRQARYTHNELEKFYRGRPSV